MTPGRSLVAISPQCKKHLVASEEQHMIYNDGPAAPDWRFSLVICRECGHGMVVYEENDPRRDSFDDPIWLYPPPPASEGQQPRQHSVRPCAKRDSVFPWELPPLPQ